MPGLLLVIEVALLLTDQSRGKRMSWESTLREVDYVGKMKDIGMTSRLAAKNELLGICFEQCWQGLLNVYP